MAMIYKRTFPITREDSKKLRVIREFIDNVDKLNSKKRDISYRDYMDIK